MDLLTAILMLVGSLNLGLAVVVLRAGIRRETNRVFSLAALSVAAWAFTNAGFRFTAVTGTAVLLAQLSYAAAVVLGAAFLHFSWTYPRPLPSVMTGKCLVWLAALSLATAAFVPGLMVVTVDIGTHSIWTAPAVYLVALHMVVTTALAFSGFWRHQSRLRGHHRAQARLVLYGSFLTAVCGLTCNLALPLSGNYAYVWAGPASSIFFVGFSVYSIVAHRLFDVRVLIRRTVAYSIVLAVLTTGFTVLEKLMERLAPYVFGDGDSLVSQLVPVLLIGLAFEPLRHSAKGLVKRWLFRGEPEGTAS